MTKPLLRFRVFFIDGTSIDIDAANPTAARDEARRRHRGIVSKVKHLREKVDGGT